MGGNWEKITLFHDKIFKNAAEGLGFSLKCCGKYFKMFPMLLEPSHLKGLMKNFFIAFLVNIVSRNAP